MDPRLLLDFARVTEAAALACSTLVGHGKKKEADGLATEAMRSAFDAVPVRGTVVIGEGEMDEAPMLYIGEVVGPDREGLPEVDIAVDPLEGTNLTAKGFPGALTVLAVAPRGTLLAAPDMYMHKIATGPAGRGVVDLDKSPRENLLALAEASGKRPDQMVAITLERPRHDAIVAELREAGCAVHLITDGDVNPAVAAGLPQTGIDLFIGKGGAPEGVLAAAALACLGGEFQGRLSYEEDGERERAIEMGLEDPDAKLQLDDIVRGDVMFAASGVTSGQLLPGVSHRGGLATVNTLALHREGGEIRWMKTRVRAD